MDISLLKLIFLLAVPSSDLLSLEFSHRFRSSLSFCCCLNSVSLCALRVSTCPR